MNSGIKCRKLRVLQKSKSAIFRGPISVSFSSSYEACKIEINQSGTREIIVSSSEERETFILWQVFQTVTELLMLFDGWFIPINSIKFSDSSKNTKEELESSSDYFNKHILNGYKTALNFSGTRNTIANFEDFDIPMIYDIWCVLRDELDIIHTMFICMCSNTKLPVDIVCANIVELFEPLSELLELKLQSFKVNREIDCNGKEKNTTLKSCLDAVITKYGQDIFQSEIAQNKEIFLQKLVNTRVRIMHIKYKMKETKYFNGDDSAKYGIKLQWLYRCVLLNLLGVEYSKYHVKLDELIDNIDCGLQWY